MGTTTPAWRTLVPLKKLTAPSRSSSSTIQLCVTIAAWMDDGWSPKLIAEVLARDHPDDRLARVSHETIYQCLYVQTRGQLRADLHRCLSTKRAARKPRGHGERRGKFNDVFTISERPPRPPTARCPGTGNLNGVVKPPEPAVAVCRGPRPVFAQQCP